MDVTPAWPTPVPAGVPPDPGLAPGGMYADNRRMSVRALIGSMGIVLLVSGCAAAVPETQVVTVTATPEPAAPDIRDEEFLEFLDFAGIPVPNEEARDTATKLGRKLCDHLNAEDYVALKEKFNLLGDLGLTSSQQGAILAASIHGYCPWNEARLRSGELSW